MGYYVEIIIGCIFVNNILLAQFLGNCPFLGTSKKMETAVGMAMAVVFVLVLAGVITWLIYTFFLVPYKIGISENHRVYPGDCLPGPVCRNVSKKEHPGAVCRAGYLSAADYHQLCGNGCLYYQYR